LKTIGSPPAKIWIPGIIGTTLCGFLGLVVPCLISLGVQGTSGVDKADRSKGLGEFP